MKQKIRTSGLSYPEKIQTNYEELWSRNVLDKYKSLSTEEIKDDLKKTALPCAVLMSQISGDFNFSCVIRNANNFNVGKIFYYGNKKYDRRGAQGTYKYSDVIFLSSLEDVLDLKKDYVFVGLENNVNNVVSIKEFKWPRNSILVLGEEGTGIPKEVLDVLDHLVEIPSKGSVRSINVASAAAIALYDYYSKL